MRSGYAELAKIVHSTFAFLTSVFLSTRLWARSTQYKGLWWDDYLCKPFNFFSLLPKRTCLKSNRFFHMYVCSGRGLGIPDLWKRSIRSLAHLRLQHPRRHHTRLGLHLLGRHVLLPHHGPRQVGLCRDPSPHLRGQDQGTALVPGPAHLGLLHVPGRGDLAGYM